MKYFEISRYIQDNLFKNILNPQTYFRSAFFYDFHLGTLGK